MKVSLLYTRITFQKNTVKVDAVGNHKSDWEDYFSCYATITNEGGSEGSAAGETVENDRFAVTVRYCSETSEITTTSHRIIVDGEIYNITAVDHMNYMRKAMKFWVQKVRR